LSVVTVLALMGIREENMDAKVEIIDQSDEE
jgi:hypothetical protein